ncbi:MAG: hypothetical protein AUJ51_09690 [Elusimicrobia bacterium CG1_02_56_21]|nr:MAG: hypothetical protein AUJ51_09690 [Elusimicrobia bacterium CG1_02_56_21]
MDFITERKKWLRFAGGAAAVLIISGIVFFSSCGRGADREEDLLRISSGTFNSTLDDVLKAEGFDDRGRYKISSALSKRLNLRRLRIEDSYLIAYSTWGPVKYLSVAKDLENYLLLPSTAAGTDADYLLSVTPVELTPGSSKLSGQIASSLWESMSAKGVPPAIILDYADIFSWSVDFLTEVRDGDKWALAWEYKADPSGRVVSQKISAAVYDGAESGRKAAAAVEGSYYDEKGDSLRSMFLRAPLHYRRISSFFTNRRYHPVLKYFRPHLGIDYAAPSGTPVSAVADGRVTFAARKGANGKLIVLRHGSGYESTYGHLSRYAKGIRSGKRVSQGDVIGYVGSTGLSSGPHLDFRVKLNGKPLNFLKIKYRSSGSVSGKARDAAAAAIKALEAE